MYSVTYSSYCLVNTDIHSFLLIMKKLLNEMGFTYWQWFYVGFACTNKHCRLLRDVAFVMWILNTKDVFSLNARYKQYHMKLETILFLPTPFIFRELHTRLWRLICNRMDNNFLPTAKGISCIRNTRHLGKIGMHITLLWISKNLVITYSIWFLSWSIDYLHFPHT